MPSRALRNPGHTSPVLPLPPSYRSQTGTVEAGGFSEFEDPKDEWEEPSSISDVERRLQEARLKSVLPP